MASGTRRSAIGTVRAAGNRPGPRHVLDLAQTQRGLTLIEVIVVIAILGLLSAVLYPTLASVLGQGDQARFDADLATIEEAVTRFKLARHDSPDLSGK